MKALTTPMAGALHTFRRCLVLLEPGSGRKWIGLVVLAIFVSALEAVAALLVLMLLGLSMTPGSAIQLPLIGDVSDIMPDTGDSSTILTVAAIVGAFFTARAGIYLFQSYLQNRLAYGAGALLARRLLRGYLAMPYGDYVGRNSADLIRNAHESTILLASTVLFPGIALAAEVCVTFVLCLVLVFSSPVAALLAFVILGVLVGGVLRFVQPRLLTLGEQVQDRTTESLKSIQQSLVGLRDIRVTGRESFFEESFGGIRQRLAYAYAMRGTLMDVPRVALETGVLLLLLLFLATQVVRGVPLSESVTILALFGYTAFRILPSVNRIVNNLQNLRFGSSLIDFLHADAVAANEVRQEGDPEEPCVFQSAIELRDVSYRYPGAARDSVTDVTLTIRRGQSVGIVGRTGSGKSTLLDLILGLLEPTTGEVRIDGQPLRGRERSWQTCLGVVPQVIFLLDDTIRNNIALGRTEDDVDDDRVLHAVKVAQLESFVASLPDGLETVIGERGVKLSGGQRQRLAIARATYHHPQVLLLDEGTSELDGKTEAEVIRALGSSSEDLTLIAVAHRLTTIRNCSLVVTMSDGRVSSLGTYEDLVEQDLPAETLGLDTKGEPSASEI